MPAMEGPDSATLLSAIAAVGGLRSGMWPEAPREEPMSTGGAQLATTYTGFVAALTGHAVEHLPIW
jgi:hypothetical protein